MEVEDNLYKKDLVPFHYLDICIPVDVIMLDLAKVFDTIPHERLLTRLNGYGMRRLKLF
jgi:hypothetical protein